MIVYSKSIEGPGGRVEWNSQGTINSELHLAKINADDQTIKVIDTTVYIEPTNAFTDIKTRCNWLDGSEEKWDFYQIVFLYVTGDYFKSYIDYYSNYANVMIANFNNDNGINNHLLQSVIKIFNDNDELKKYMEENYNDTNILAFFGTTTYLFFNLIK